MTLGPSGERVIVPHEGLGAGPRRRARHPPRGVIVPHEGLGAGSRRPSTGHDGVIVPLDSHFRGACPRLERGE